MKLKIRTRLVLGFVIIFILLLTMAVYMISKFADSNTRLVNIVEFSAKKINLSNEILIGILDATRHEKNLILEKDPSQKKYFKERLYSAVETVEIGISELQSLVDSKGEKILNEFLAIWKVYTKQVDDIVEYSLNDKDEEAFAISATTGLKLRDSMIKTMSRLIKKNEESMLADKASNDQSFRSAFTLMILLIVISILASFLISYWITQTIAKRIAFISTEAEKIASREYTSQTLTDDVNDELLPVFRSLSSINESFKEITENANRVATGDYTVNLIPRSEKDVLGNSLVKMTKSLVETTALNEKHNWLTSGQNLLNEHLRGDKSIEALAATIVDFLASYLKANIGALYMLEDKAGALVLTAGHAFGSAVETKKRFALNEGLVGQCAAEQKMMVLSDLKEDQLRVSSAILDAKPKSLIVAPFLFENKTVGVVELGKLTAFSETELEFINSVLSSIGVSFNSAISRQKIQELLAETQAQSEELQTQQEELRQLNEELEEQTQNLKHQQEELQMTNEELEEQTQALETKNKEVEEARTEIEQKSKELEISSRYKSEFLANMSHELRTPLNSLLILSKDLADNKRKNLDPEQVESANIIYKSGNDLLSLINEVLDLSKIEAGKMTLNTERISLNSFTDALFRDFKHQADQKGLNLSVTIEKGTPDSIRTDQQRLSQILKNLLSNAIKFTQKGFVKVNVEKEGADKIRFSVIDSGIGIPEEKQRVIFEAFQQADGGTSRKYGGTGLGLSISRQLAKLLDGEIQVTSKSGEGSAFSLVIPVELNEGPVPAREHKTDRPIKPAIKNVSYYNYPTIADDREDIKPGDVVVLVIEDDLKFAKILYNQAHQKGFKCIAASTGEDGLVLAEKFKPSAIILDIKLPGIDGHRVLSELKENTLLRHIPVHIISVNERSMESIKEGAIEYLVKPIGKEQLDEAFARIENFVNRKMRNLLIVEDDANLRKSIRKLIGNGDVKCLDAGSGQEAIELYENHQIDCIVLDIGLPDMSGFDLIYKLEKLADKLPPIIIYTGRELTREENDELHKYAESIIIKGVKSEERLLDETALFLHRAISNLPEPKQRIITGLYDKDAIFQGKTILVVDDDMRNVFALSRVLKDNGMNVLKAENGKVAIDQLEKHNNIQMVLMDIMMPEMDGYEAMRKIREQQAFKSLPIIALTAKAMKDDKQKCIDAGASDYITKPVDVDRLLSLMRVWLSK